MAGGAVTSLTAPTLSLTVSGAYAPNDPSVRTVYYRQNDAQGPYTAAIGSGPFTANLAGLQLGENVVSLYAVDAMEGTSINTSGGGVGGTSSMIGAPMVFALTLVSPPVITTASPLATGTAGTAYSQTITANGGTGALSFAVTAGTLPVGLTLSTAGLLSGTPLAGSASFTVTVTDASGGTGAQVFSLTINAGVPGAPTGVSATAGNAQATVTFVAPSDNGSGITGYTVTSNPAGGVDSNAGSTSLSHVITGLTNGTAYTFTVVATNAVGASPASAASNSVTPLAATTTTVISSASPVAAGSAVTFTAAVAGAT